MKLLLLAISTLSFISCSSQKPTKANIEKAILSTWEKPASTSSPRQSVTFHSIKIGASAKANDQDKIDGIPPTSVVTIAQIDFTVREYYNDRISATHRVMLAKVFKDQFSEWAAKSNSMRTIETKAEPVE